MMHIISLIETPLSVNQVITQAVGKSSTSATATPLLLSIMQIIVQALYSIYLFPNFIPTETVPFALFL